MAHYEAWIKDVQAYAAADGVGPRPTEMPVDGAAAAARQAMDPRSENTVGDMVDRFMVWAEAQSEKRTEDGGVSPAMVSNWKNDGCKKIVAFFGRAKKLTDIKTTDFDTFRYSAPITKCMDGVTPAAEVTVANRIDRCLKVLNWAGNVKLDDRLRTIPFSTGLEFNVIKGEPLEDRPTWSVEQYNAQLGAADVKWVAMLLLALNSSFQNADIYRFPIDEIHPDRELPVHTYPRVKGKSKTGKKRACILWKRTAEAIQAYLRVRPKPASTDDAKFLFLQDDGTAYTQKSFGIEFNGTVKIEGAPNFRHLRHSFASHASDGYDGAETAIKYIQGKSLGKHIAVYKSANKQTLLHFPAKPIQECVDRVEKFYFA